MASLLDSPFVSCEGRDPALPGDPWSHLRFRYGQLLGADDMTAEQRAFLLRHRLHLALLHGFGTVWGLEVTDERLPDPQPRVRLVVEPGVAVDAVGREIYVPERQCLDITDLNTTTFWSKLEAPPAEGDEDAGEGGEEAGAVRRAYVVICYEACLSDLVPAITPPCGDAEDAFAYGRVSDRFRIDLVETPPDDPNPLHREWLRSQGGMSHLDDWVTLRDRLCDFLLNAMRSPDALRDPESDPLPDVARYWSELGKQSLLLAAVDLEVAESEAGAETRVQAVHNHVRALLPPVQLVAETLLGQRLIGADRRAPFKVVEVSALPRDEDEDGPAIVARFTAPPAEGTLTPESVVVSRLDENGEWAAVPLADPAFTVDEWRLIVRLEGPWTAATTYQLHLVGRGPRPILATDGRPLAGWWDEPVPAPGRGRDADVVAVWQPPTP